MNDYVDMMLDALRWHWGEAYIIDAPEPGIWIAVRRDTHTTLRGSDPEILRDLIVTDYCHRQVPRSLHAPPVHGPGPVS